MKLTKKKVFVAALALSLIAIISVGTLAWFQATDEVTNYFQVSTDDETQKPDFKLDLFEHNVLPDGTLGVYYEENGVSNAFVMRFVRFSLDWASNGKYKFTEDAPFIPIKSTNETGIDDVMHNVETNAPAAIYDLSGRRVQQVQKGIYIQNGKKVIMNY